MTAAGTPTGPSIPDWDPPVPWDDYIDTALVDDTAPQDDDRHVNFGRTYRVFHIDESVFGADVDPIAELDENLTTPERSPFLFARYAALNRRVSPDPGDLNWGIFAYEVNVGTAPVTPLAARARGETVYTISSSGRAYGANPEIHGFEVTAGIHPSEATVTMTSGTPTLENVVVTERGSRFEAGMVVTGPNIPGSTTILSVVGDPWAPTSITLSANVTGSGAAVAILAEPAVGNAEAIGVLLTGNSGSSTINNHMDAAVQIQSQNTPGRWLYGINQGASALHQTSGIAYRLASATARRALSVESCNLEDAILITGGSMSNSAIRISGDAPIKIGQAIGAGKGFLELWEQSADAAAPGANAGRLFLKDNGAGKTQLCVRFNTGAVQVIATEP